MTTSHVSPARPETPKPRDPITPDEPPYKLAGAVVTRTLRRSVRLPSAGSALYGGAHSYGAILGVGSSPNGASSNMQSIGGPTTARSGSFTMLYAAMFFRTFGKTLSHSSLHAAFAPASSSAITHGCWSSLRSGWTPQSLEFIGNGSTT